MLIKKIINTIIEIKKTIPKIEDSLTSKETTSALSANQGRELKALIDAIKIEMKPIGSIEINTSGENPSGYLGGTWIAWGAGRVPVGVDSSTDDLNEAEKIGGEKNHTLTENEIPSHTHGSIELTGKATFSVLSSINSANKINTVSGIFSRETASDGYADITDRVAVANQYSILAVDATHEHASIGGSGSHNNMPPYVTCFMWKRIA